METPKKSRRPKGSLAVAIGILGSRLAGLVRQSVFAFFFGNTDAADVFNAGFRIPNLLQNLFGEGALSASFIPVYSRLRAEGREEEAEKVAWAVASALALLTCLLVLLGVLFTPLLIDLIAPGFTGAKREETITLVQIFFPGAGLLVMSAWCLGVLNSHRAFLLSYLAPVVWSGAIVGFLLVAGRAQSGYRLAEWAAWGSFAGSALQFLVQVPFVLKFLSFRRGDFRSTHVRAVLKNFVPVALSRGVVQISAYVDQIIASFLPTGAVAALGYAQVIYTLPISLFGMAVSAAELPEMSSAVGSAEEINAAIRARLSRGLSRIAFFVVPSVVVFVALGDLVAELLFMRGRFTSADAAYVWVVLAGSSVGLLAVTLGRLYASAFYALRDTRTPFKFAALRVLLTVSLGYLCALPLPRMLGIDPALGAAGLTASAGVAGWVEFLLLRRGLERNLGPTRIRRGELWPLWVASLTGAALAWAVKLPLRETAHPMVKAFAALGVFGAGYLMTAMLLKVEDALALGRKLRRSAHG